MITQRTLFDSIQNPRRGTRRFGGSTQAAARARRAPAPAAPAAAAPKKARATKPRTRKTVAGNSLFFKLLNAVPVKKNALQPEDIHSWGSVRFDDVQRFAMTDGISFVFLDSLEGDKKSAFKEYIESKSNRSRSQYNVENGLSFISNSIKSKSEITNENISRARINGAFVERKRLKPTSSYRGGIIEFLFPPGVVGEDYQSFDLCRTKFLVRLTEANRIVVGYTGNTTNAPVLLYRNDLLVAFFNGTTGGQSSFRNGDQVNDILDQLNIKRNPRKGTRRFGGSTQAAARARRALAPAAPAPALAPKKTRARRAPAPAAPAPALAPKKARARRAPSAKGVKGVLGDLLSRLPFRLDDWYKSGIRTKIWLADTFISNGAIVLYKHGMTPSKIAKFGKPKPSEDQPMVDAKVLPPQGQDKYKEEKVLKENQTRRAFQPLEFASFVYSKKKWVPIETPLGLPIKSGMLSNIEKTLYYVQSDSGQRYNLKLIKTIQTAVEFDHVEESTKGDPLLFFFNNNRLVALLIGLRELKDGKWLPVSEVLSSLENQG
jgi:hypothetical protein